MPEHVYNRSLDRLKAFTESLLFVADEPVTSRDLAAALEAKSREVDEALAHLEAEYRDRGLRLQRKDGRVQMVTAPEAAEAVERFLGLQQHSRGLSEAALEALAITAYEQPVTRAEIEAVRGVNCDSVLRTLLSRGLIEEKGRLDKAGRPILYGTTFTFLQYFGLESLDQLPPLDGAEIETALTEAFQSNE